MSENRALHPGIRSRLNPSCDSHGAALRAVSKSQGFPSIPRVLVHDIFQRFPRRKALEIVEEELHAFLEPGGGVVRAVRRQKHILHSEKRMARCKRLLLEHV